MFEFQVIGFYRSSGTYEGRKYDNYVLQGTTPNIDPKFKDTNKFPEGFQGRQVMTVKVPARWGYLPNIGDTLALEYGPNGLNGVEVMR